MLIRMLLNAWCWQTVSIRHIYMFHKIPFMLDLVFNIPRELFLINENVLSAFWMRYVVDEPQFKLVKWFKTTLPHPFQTCNIQFHWNTPHEVGSYWLHRQHSWLLFINFKNWNAISFQSRKKAHRRSNNHKKSIQFAIPLVFTDNRLHSVVYLSWLQVSNAC